MVGLFSKSCELLQVWRPLQGGWLRVEKIFVSIRGAEVLPPFLEGHLMRVSIKTPHRRWAKCTFDKSESELMYWIQHPKSRWPCWPVRNCITVEAGWTNKFYSRRRQRLSEPHEICEKKGSVMTSSIFVSATSDEPQRQASCRRSEPKMCVLAGPIDLFVLLRLKEGSRDQHRRNEKGKQTGFSG